MRIKIDVELAYEIEAGDSVLLTLEAAQAEGQVVLASDLHVDNGTLQHPATAAGGVPRVWAEIEGRAFRLRYCAEVQVTRTATDLTGLTAAPLTELPGEVLTYLRPSRYCQSDLFTDMAATEFGAYEGGEKVAAIQAWVAAHLAYAPGASDVTTTATDTLASRQGVCRDYVHLMCSLARAASIPARYASVYGPTVTPDDFHAMVEVYLDGAWHLTDPTGMCRANQAALIGSGRDAGDVAFMETENWAHFISQSVRARAVSAP